jgi:hypothetical protein
LPPGPYATARRGRSPQSRSRVGPRSQPPPVRQSTNACRGSAAAEVPQATCVRLPGERPRKFRSAAA